MAEPYTGYRAIEGALERGLPGELLYCRESRRIDAMIALAGRKGVSVRLVQPESLESLCRGIGHRGVVFIPEGSANAGNSGGRSHTYTTLSACIAATESRSSIVLVLDGITDPHNLGAVLRSADLFHVDFVVVPRHRSARYGPVAAQSSAGAGSYIRLCEVPNLVRAMEELKEAGYWIYAAEMEGTPLMQAAFDLRTVIVLGGEGSGVHRLVREHCDAGVTIPSHGHVDSFNVSVAAGIILYEIRRQVGFFVSSST